VQAFDPLHTPLEGTLLMEASAGTGKTHTIASLFVRLVLEKALEVDRILVVTFTEAASAELKERIYARLSDTLAAMEGRPCKESFSEEMGQRHGRDPKARLKILTAIRNFDRASIGTIHAFCYRMLRENRFESGLRFDAGLVTEAGVLRQNAADDVWRKEMACLDERVAALWVRNLTPERLAILAGRYGGPDTHLTPHGDMPDLLPLVGMLSLSEERVKEIWREDRKTLCTLLRTDTRLNRNILRSATLEKGFRELDAWSLGLRTALPDILGKLSPWEMQRATKKGASTPQSPLWEACGALQEARKTLDEASDLAHALFMKTRIQAVRLRETELKEEAGLLTFDDLLVRLRDAVLRDGQEGMCQRIRELFGAALIDEFQDTDPVQYAIFDRVFGESGLPLLLIGDPKQAIYAFRGADVFAYLEAARKSRNRYTLDRNWRSDPALIDAVNRIFSKNPKAFVLDAMEFIPVQAADKEREVFTDPENPEAFTFWLGESPDGEGLTVDGLRRRALGAVSDEMVRLLEGGLTHAVRMGERGLGPGDMAVLVRSNHEALLTRNFLSERGIPAVIHSDGNVFDSPEAEELFLLLSAMLQPWDGARLRRALATEMLGFTLKDIDLLNKDEVVFHGQVRFFLEARRLWRERGVLRMLTDLYERGGVLVRVAGLFQGERRVTNLLHLAELLHTAENQEKRGPEVLLRWFERQRDSSLPRRVEAPLRLESDGERVRILTVHRSKGLEFPIVFCPFLYTGSDILDPGVNPEKVLVFHDPERGQGLCVDFGGSGERSREEALARKEALAEQTRLLYVALTRARHRVYAVWGRIRRVRGRAAAWVLHGVEGALPDALELEKDMMDLAQPGVLGCRPLPEDRGMRWTAQAGDLQALMACAAPSLSQDAFRISSFSSLVAGRYMDTAADRDGISYMAQRETGRPEGGIAAFPAGTRAGTFMHHVFENLDFTGSPLHWQAVVEKSLGIYGYDGTWTPVICDMVDKVMRLSLGEGGFSLKEVAPGARIRELDFYFPLNMLDSRDISRWVREITQEACDFIPEQLERLQFSRTSGYLRGVMDLVVYHGGQYFLLDWKSNYLGESPGDYGPEMLKREMAAHLYTLQYHLYVLALDRYLSLRLEDYDYERDFGGVAYVFLRGVDPDAAPGCGLFFEKPPAERIRQMGRWMMAEGLMKTEE